MISTVEIIIIVSVIIFFILILIDLMLPGFLNGETDSKVEIVSKSNEFSINEEILNFMSSINFTNLIALSLLPIGVILIKITQYFKTKGFSNESTDSTKKWKSDDKIKNDSGYKAALYLDGAISMLESVLKHKSDSFNESFNEVIKKMDDTLKMYLADHEEFGINMYKYEKTFRIICETINKSVVSNQIEEKELSKTINNLIKIPYEEIVKEKGSKWLYAEGKYEYDVLKGIKKMNS